MIIAVIEQTIIVSMNGPSIATKPSLTGSVVFAAPCAIVSVPVPASLENIPRRTPIIIMLPSAPPETAFPVKASLIINANTPAVCVVGKSWDFHVKVALGIKNEENLENIRETTKHFVKNNKEFLFDAEHFFDGYKANPEYAINCLKEAYDNGARWIVLCDTNGGTLPNEIREIVSKVSKTIPGKNLGIHAHNDLSLIHI